MDSLKDVKVGQSAVIKKIHGQGATKRRIMDMGITKGQMVFVRKVAPLGDPMEITIRGYELTLRKTDAQTIEVEASRIAGEAEQAQSTECRDCGADAEEYADMDFYSSYGCCGCCSKCRGRRR